MPRIDVDLVPRHTGTGYPPPFDAPCLKRVRQRLGDAAGLTQFGVNLLRLAPGTWSSQRHFHAREDEFVWVVRGEVVLVTDAGEQVLRAGDCAGFKAGGGEGHHVQNRSGEEAVLLEVGTRSGEDCVVYPDIDLLVTGDGPYTNRAGVPYPGQ
jgi:uncharacterized cupin superfamily protein